MQCHAGAATGASHGGSPGSRLQSRHPKTYWPGLKADRYGGGHLPEAHIGTRSPLSSSPGAEKPQNVGGSQVWANALFDVSLASSQECEDFPGNAVSRAQRGQAKCEAQQGEGCAPIGHSANSPKWMRSVQGKRELGGEREDEGTARMVSQGTQAAFGAQWAPLAIDDPSVLFSSFDLLHESRASSSVSALLQSIETGKLRQSLRNSLNNRSADPATEQAAPPAAPIAASWHETHCDIFLSCRTPDGGSSQDGPSATWSTCRSLKRLDADGDAALDGPGLYSVGILSSADLLTGAFTVAAGLKGMSLADERAGEAPHPWKSPQAPARSRGVMDIVRGLENVTKLTQREIEEQNRRLKRRSSACTPASRSWGSYRRMPDEGPAAKCAASAEFAADDLHVGARLPGAARRGAAVCASAPSLCSADHHVTHVDAESASSSPATCTGLLTCPSSTAPGGLPPATQAPHTPRGKDGTVTVRGNQTDDAPPSCEGGVPNPPSSSTGDQDKAGGHTLEGPGMRKVAGRDAAGPYADGWSTNTAAVGEDHQADNQDPGTCDQSSSGGGGLTGEGPDALGCEPRACAPSICASIESGLLHGDQGPQESSGSLTPEAEAEGGWAAGEADAGTGGQLEEAGSTLLGSPERSTIGLAEDGGTPTRPADVSPTEPRKSLA